MRQADPFVDLNSLLNFGLASLRHIDRKVQVWGPGDRGALPPLFGPPPAPPVVVPDQPTPGTRDMGRVAGAGVRHRFQRPGIRQPVPRAGSGFAAYDVPIPARFTEDPYGNPHPRMSPVTFYEDDRVRVLATLVCHAPVFPALAYRFDTDDGSVTFSGDTAPSDNLVELATGADVLVHEVIDPEWVESLFPEPRGEQEEAVIQHLIGAHTPVEQVCPIAERAGRGHPRAGAPRSGKLAGTQLVAHPARIQRQARRGP